MGAVRARGDAAGFIFVDAQVRETREAVDDKEGISGKEAKVQERVIGDNET